MTRGVLVPYYFTIERNLTASSSTTHCSNRLPLPHNHHSFASMDGSNEHAQRKETTCLGCGKLFESRNAVFRHIQESNGACLDDTERQEYWEFMQSRQREKVVILFGYFAEEEISDRTSPIQLKNGDDAARLILEVLEDLIGSSVEQLKQKYTRSYGNSARGNEVVRQDDWTSAVTEILSTRLPPLMQPVGDWIDQVNERLLTKLTRSTGDGPQIRILGRQTMKAKKFNAEIDVTHRRVEYLFPVDFLFAAGFKLHENIDNVVPGDVLDLSREEFSAAMPYFDDAKVQDSAPEPRALEFMKKVRGIMRSLATHHESMQGDRWTSSSQVRVGDDEVKIRERHDTGHETVERDISLETTSTAAADEQAILPRHLKTKQSRNRHGQNRHDKSKPRRKKPGKRTFILQRRRYHNFTPTLVAHEYMAYRKMDRLFHKAVLRYRLNSDEENAIACHEDVSQRCFYVFSVSGDTFLHGQVRHVMGLLMALARGLVSTDIVECVFDEGYTHLVPTPALPTLGMYSVEAGYVGWEGKLSTVLCPRVCDRFPHGWGDAETLQRVFDWKQTVRRTIAARWLKGRCDPDGRLKAERVWTEEILEPWVENTKKILKHYREWKEDLGEVARLSAQGCTEKLSDSRLVPSLNSKVPRLFQAVLHYLREANAGGNWPSTSSKRQLVIVSESKVDENADCLSTHRYRGSSTLSIALMKANSKRDRCSAYSFVEGEGGASGSFSIGAMPGECCIQPKANSTFPKLMKAAFELEMALCPDREPSSTIAINRNAQFRPHTDVGAGAGQSTSLIVGLGDYIGGELVVEGKQHDIRYKPLEFDGWKQRHWTMPFVGERYSLVWFTPKGCEGVRGIDLCTE